MTSHETAETLNKLIQTSKDGEAGFQTAMEAIKDENLKHLFAAYSQQRASFADDLQQLVELVASEEPQHRTSVASAIHRGWMNLRSAVADGSDATILSECERGEDSAVRNYEDALEKDLPQNVRAVVDSQYRCILEAHDQIRELRDAHKALS